MAGAEATFSQSPPASQTYTFGSSTTDSSDDEEVPSVPSLNLTDEIRAQKVNERLASQKTLSQKSTNDRGKYQDDELSSPGSMSDDSSSLLDSDSDAQSKENVEKTGTSGVDVKVKRRMPRRKKGWVRVNLIRKKQQQRRRENMTEEAKAAALKKELERQAKVRQAEKAKKVRSPTPPATEQRKRSGSAPVPPPPTVVATETQYQPLSQMNEEGGITGNDVVEQSPEVLENSLSQDEGRLSLVKSHLLTPNRRDSSFISSTPMTIAKERLARVSDPVPISPVQKVGGTSMKNLILNQKSKAPNPLPLRRTAAIAASAANGAAAPVPGRKSLSDSFSAEAPAPPQKSKKSRMSVAAAPTAIRGPPESNISASDEMDVDYEAESEIPPPAPPQTVSSPTKRTVTKTAPNNRDGLFLLPSPRTNVRKNQASKSKRDTGPGRRRTVSNPDDADDEESEFEEPAEAATPTKRARVKDSSQERRIFAPSGPVIHSPMIKKTTRLVVELERLPSLPPPPQNQQQQKHTNTFPPIRPVSESKKNKKEKRLSEAQQMDVEPNIMSTPNTVTETAKKKKNLSPQPLEEPKKAGPDEPGTSIQESVGEPDPVSSSPKPKRPRTSLSTRQVAEPVVEQKKKDKQRQSEVDVEQVVIPSANPETVTVKRKTVAVQTCELEQREGQAVVASAPPPPTSPSKKQPSPSVSAKQSRRKKCKCLLV